MARYAVPSQRPERFTLNQWAPLADGLVFAGLGADVGSTRYADSSLYGNDGTLTGFTGAGNTPADRWGWDATLRRPSLGFDGVADYVLLPAFPVTGSFTLATWIKPTMINAYQVLFSKDANGQRDFDFGFSFTAGKLVYVDNPNLSVPESGVVVDTSLQHVAVTRAGTAITFWRNGVACGTGTSTSAFTQSAALNLGRRATTSAYQWYGGPMADPLIVFRALAPDEIKAQADLDNVDLRVGGVPLVLPVRRYWPTGLTGSTTYQALSLCDF